MRSPAPARVRSALRVLAVVVALATAAAACSDSTATTERFCEQLGIVTGPDGAELALVPGDPERLAGVVAELDELLDRAPDEIATATSTLADFFTSYQRASRTDRPGLLVDNEQRLAAASAELDAYALESCGLFLQRAVPTPLPTPDPGISVPDE